MSSPIIHAERLSKVYPGGRTALSAMDLSVSEGEILGFLGPNGAGKTSTIKILTTLSRPSSGTASVAGLDVVREPAAVRRVIGYVAQEAGVDYFLTGRENLVLQGRLYHLDARIIAERTNELLALFALESVADQLVSSYSGGTKRKLDIATALLHRPKVLFLDEPTLGLDLQSRHALWDYIRRLNASDGMTIFLTTHYLEEADKLAHRVAIVDQGGVKAVGTPEVLKDGVGGDTIRMTFDGGAPGPSVWQLLKSHPLVNDVVADGDSLHVVVKEGREALPKLLPALDTAHAGLRSITLSRPSLDDVFLKHTGKAFSSETASPGGEAWWTKWQKGGGGSWGNKPWSESSTDEKGPTDAGHPEEAAAPPETAKPGDSGAPAWKQWSGGSSESQQGTWNGNGQSQGSGSESWPQQTWDKDKGR
jgi:ABC-2 type transport system ATP-binding protein